MEEMTQNLTNTMNQTNNLIQCLVKPTNYLFKKNPNSIKSDGFNFSPRNYKKYSISRKEVEFYEYSKLDNTTSLKNDENLLKYWYNSLGGDMVYFLTDWSTELEELNHFFSVYLNCLTDDFILPLKKFKQENLSFLSKKKKKI